MKMLKKKTPDRHNAFLYDYHPATRRRRAAVGLVYFMFLTTLILILELYTHPGYFALCVLLGIIMGAVLFHDRSMILGIRPLGAQIPFSQKQTDHIRFFVLTSSYNLAHSDNAGSFHSSDIPAGGKKRQSRQTRRPHWDPLFVFNRKNNHLVAIGGIELKAMALHIKPNFSDFLRRLQAISSFIPLCIQMSVSNNQFSYRMFISKRIKNPTHRKAGELLTTFQQIGAEFRTALISNMTHFKFSFMDSTRTARSILGKNVIQKSPISKKKTGHREPMGFWKMLTVFFMANIFALGYILFE
ncbi:MAG TPA: hypothetical protein VKO42_02535, partial [Patescibacteria group bacterium]|nr:hypothetical protein [Patescibacteria group bacterium]